MALEIVNNEKLIELDGYTHLNANHELDWFNLNLGIEKNRQAFNLIKINTKIRFSGNEYLVIDLKHEKDNTDLYIITVKPNFAPYEMVQ